MGLAEKDKTAKRDEDQQAGRKERTQADLVSYKQAQKCIKLEAVDCQMLLKGQTRGEKRKKEKKKAPGYKIAREVIWHPGGLRS